MSRKVVGVSFEGGDGDAPSVILKGAGAEADALLDQARERDIPIVEAPEPARVRAAMP